MMWRWIEAFLRRCLPAERIEDAVGDLMELHPERRERFGAWAPLVTAVDALSFGTTMLFARVRDLLREGFDAVLSATFEVRLAWRLVRKRPLLNAVALLTLAAGLGLMSVGLSYASGLLFSELPYADGERYVRIEVTDPATGRRIRSLDPGWLDRLRTDVPAFTFFGGKDHEQLNIFHANGDVDTVTGVVMSGGAFDVLPATPRLGRTLTAADSAPGARPVVVLRESLWRTRFGASDAVLGQSIDVGGERRQVVGVLPDTFLFPNRPLLWVPLEERHWGGSADGSSPGIELFAVLHSEADRRLAKDQVEAAGSPLPPSADAADAAPRLRVVGYTEPSRPGEVWAGTGGLIAALLLILTVIAAQVGHLFAARNAGRAKELSMRLALGARRSQVVAQLWWEVAVIVALAAGLAAWGSHGVLRWLQAQLDEAPFWLRLEPGLPAFAALTAIALFTTWAAGLAPALRVTRRTTLAGVAGGRGAVGPSGDAGRTGSAMAIFEMAMAVALFTVAVGLGRGAVEHLALPESLPGDKILTANLRLPAVEAPMEDPAGEWRRAAYAASRSELRRRLEALPGVDAVGLTTALPGEAPYRERVVIEPAVEDTDARSRVMAAIASVDPGFFTALDARPLVGRLFRPADLLADAPPVAIVDRAFAERHFAGASPLGHRLRLDDDGESGRTFEVVGVVADLGLSPTDPGGLYLPLRGGRGVDLLLRVAGEPLTFAGALRAEVGAHDSTATLRRIQPLDAVAKDSATTLGAVGGAAVLAGGSALVLSWLGLFAVTALRVTERRREIGVRRALGARNIQILAWLGRRTLIRVALGAALGAVAFLLLHRALVSAELGLASRIVDLPLVGLAFVVGAALATAGPAVRALRIDPARALGAD